MRSSEENGINGISGKHPCGRAYRSTHFEKYLVVRKHLEKNSKRFVVTRNGGGPHPCGSAPKPFNLTPRQYLTRKWYVPIPKARHTSHSVPIRQVNAFLIFQCNTKVLYKPTCMSSPQDFSPTTISDRLTPTRLIPDHAPPLLGKILEDALFSSFAAKFQELHAQTMKYTCVVMLMFPHYEERRNQTKLHDYSPAQNHFHSPIQMLQIIRFYLKSGLYSSRCIRETHPHFCHRQDVESKDVRIFAFGDDYLFTYIEEMNRFLSAGGGLW